MIVVSSLTSSEEAFRRYKPSFVVSILDCDEGPAPTFNGLAKERHIELRGDCASNEAKSSICTQIVELANKWDRNEPILIHCQQGVARSMAAAYILLCAVESERCEIEIAKRLRQAAPHADPNLLLISEADKLMHRDDRMVEAILDMCPCAGAVCNDIVTLPLAA